MNSQVNTPWLKVVRVTPLEDFQLLVELENGQQMRLTLKKLIQNREHYWRLRNPRYFRQVQIDPLGGIIYWTEGEDLAPDGLQRYMEKVQIYD